MYAVRTHFPHRIYHKLEGHRDCQMCLFYRFFFTAKNETVICDLVCSCLFEILSYFWLERLPSCVTLFPEQTDTSGQVKLSILHLSSALVFLTIWPDQLCQFVPLCLPPQKDCYKVSPSYFTTIQTFLRFFFQDILTKCKVSPSYLTTNQNFLRFFPKFQDILTKYCPSFSNLTKPNVTKPNKI